LTADAEFSGLRRSLPVTADGRGQLRGRAQLGRQFGKAAHVPGSKPPLEVERQTHRRWRLSGGWRAIVQTFADAHPPPAVKGGDQEGVIGLLLVQPPRRKDARHHAPRLSDVGDRAAGASALGLHVGPGPDVVEVGQVRHQRPDDRKLLAGGGRRQLEDLGFLQHHQRDPGPRSWSVAGVATASPRARAGV
jgi:hypothetical protein